MTELKYFNELARAMTWLGEKENTVFLGQSVGIEGTSMYGTLNGVLMDKRHEIPVIENTQMGMSIGMALDGKTVPISIFPRMDFLTCGMDQLCNHLDKIIDYSNGEYKPKVIIRVGIGSVRPLHPQAQHCNDYSDAFAMMLKNVEVIKLHEPDDIFPAYERAYLREDGKSTILVEFSDFLNER